MAKLPKEIRVKTDALPSEVQAWMLSQMERYGKKAPIFLKDFLIRYYDDHVVQKVKKVEIVGVPVSTPYERQKTSIRPPKNTLVGALEHSCSSVEPAIGSNDTTFDENNKTMENFF